MALIAAHLDVGVILLDVKHHVCFQKGFKEERDRLNAVTSGQYHLCVFVPS